MSVSEEVAGEQLARTCLRDFRPPIPLDERYDVRPRWSVTLSRREAPVPVLLRYALKLIGIPHYGPGEKVEWWVPFSYEGYSCELAHEKFGLRLRIGGDVTKEQAQNLLTELRKKLGLAVRTVERLLVETASDTFNAGDVTVANQHQQLRRAYDYFRRRDTNPDVVDDVSESGTSESGSWSTFLLGASVMAMNAFHDLIAAMSAFLSSLEHDLVLALPFRNFDPTADNLRDFILGNWGDKWRRVVGCADPEAVALRERLILVVERWRNPYSHGGFEKKQGATIYLHTPELGALPIGLSGVRESPLFSLYPASDADIEGVFALFDEIDAYLGNAMPHAMEWISSGLPVRFDAAFREEVESCINAEGSLEELIAVHSERADMIANMDY